MGVRERNKGKRGEREVASIIRDMTGWDVRRTVRQHDGDRDLCGIPGWSAEVKNCARLALPAWWRQAVEQAAKERLRPVLLYKVPRRGWRALWHLSALVDGVPGWETPALSAESMSDLSMTCDTSIEAWVTVALSTADDDGNERAHRRA